MSNRKKGYLLILFSALIFSTTEIGLKLLGGAFSPMQLTCERVLIGGFFVLPSALREMKNIRLDRSDWAYFAKLGFLTVTLHMSLLQMAVLHMDTSATAAIYSTNPIFSIIAAHFLLHEPIRRNHAIAIGMEFIGILLILNPTQLEVSLRGFFEMLFGTIFFALYGTLCKFRMERLGSVVISCFNMLFGGGELLIMLLLGKIPAVAAFFRSCGLELFANVSLTAGFSLRSTLLLLYVGIFCAGLGFLFMAKITEYTSAIEASFIYLFKPIFAAIFAVLVFREVISINRALGIAFFVAAKITFTAAGSACRGAFEAPCTARRCPLLRFRGRSSRAARLRRSFCRGPSPYRRG